jgi:hypothetical protein
MLIRIGNVLINDKNIDSIKDSSEGIKVSMNDGETREFPDVKLDDVVYPFQEHHNAEFDLEMITNAMNRAGYDLVEEEKVRA